MTALVLELNPTVRDRDAATYQGVDDPLLDALAEVPCRTVDPELFFPATRRLDERPFEVCRQCPVRVACYQAAHTNRETGIWGGRRFERGHDITDEAPNASVALGVPSMS